MTGAVDGLPTIMEATDRDHVLARRRRVVMIVGAGLLLVIVAVIIGSRARTAGPEPPPGVGLLPWAPRGELVDDAALVASAEALWRGSTDVDAATVVAPEGEIYLLWADQIAAGRLVLLQAIGVDGRPYVAQVSEQGDPAVLGLDAVQPLPADPLLALAVTYDGNVHIPGLEPGPGSAYIQLLPEPPESSVSTGLWRYQTSSGSRELVLLETKPNGMTDTFLQLDTSDPDGTPVVVSTTIGGRAAVAATLAVRAGALVSTSARIALVDDPEWGPSGRIDGGEYTALVLAATDLRLADATGFVAASEELDVDGLPLRASLVVLRETRSPTGRVACVLTEADDGPADVVVGDVVVTGPVELSMGDVRVLAGSCHLLLGRTTSVVALAAARPGDGPVRLESDGRVVAGPSENLVTVLDGPAALGPLVARLDGDDGPGSFFSIRPLLVR